MIFSCLFKSSLLITNQAGDTAQQHGGHGGYATFAEYAMAYAAAHAQVWLVVELYSLIRLISCGMACFMEASCDPAFSVSITLSGSVFLFVFAAGRHGWKPSYYSFNGTSTSSYVEPVHEVLHMDRCQWPHSPMATSILVKLLMS